MDAKIVKDTLCSHLWDHIIVNFMKMQVGSCCKTPPIGVSKEEVITLKDDIISNHPYYIDQRVQMLNGLKNEACQTCWNLEKNNMPSFRSSSQNWLDHINRRFEEQKSFEQVDNYDNDEIAQSHHPINLDIQLDNTCDLKCLYCNQEYSTQWEKEFKKYGSMPHEVNQTLPQRAAESDNELFKEAFWKWFEKKKSGFTRIAFLGGEPLFSPLFYNFLDKIGSIYSKPQEGLAINIITNLNSQEHVFEKFLTKILELEKKLTLNINISMESWGDKAEYIRNGVNFERFLKNYELLLAKTNPDKVILSTITSINVLSLSSLFEYIKWIDQAEMKYKREVTLYSNLISYPHWLSIELAHQSFVKDIDQVISYLTANNSKRTLGAQDNWNQYINFLNNIKLKIIKQDEISEDLKRIFSKSVSEIDKRRGSNFKEIFPEFDYLLC